MTDQAASTSKLETGVSQLRCIACGAVRESGAKNVRCSQCGDLLEVVYPGWKTSAGMRAAGFDAAGLKELWRQRRTSYDPLDAERRLALSRSSSRVAATGITSSPCAKATRRCTNCPVAAARQEFGSFTPSIRA